MMSDGVWHLVAANTAGFNNRPGLAWFRRQKAKELLR